MTASEKGNHTSPTPDRRLNLEDLLRLNTELRALTKTEAPLAAGLRAMGREMKGGRLKRAIAELVARLEEGDDLADALEDQSGQIPTLYVQLVRAGMAMGNVSIVLAMLTRHFQGLLALRRRVVELAVYPVLLSVVGLSITAWIVFATIPEYVIMYQELGVDLPLMTALYAPVTVDGPLVVTIIVSAVLAVFSSLLWVGLTQRGRLLLERVYLTMPGLGGLLRSLWTARLCRTLALLLRNRLPMPTAFSLVAGATGSALARRMAEGIAAQTEQGDSFGAALEASPLSRLFFANTAVLILCAAEESGDLHGALEQLADAAEVSAEGYARAIQSLVPAGFAVVSGLLVLVLVGAMILPLINLMEHCMG